jgi:hypothetical protein
MSKIFLGQTIRRRGSPLTAWSAVYITAAGDTDDRAKATLADERPLTHG